MGRIKDILAKLCDLEGFFAAGLLSPEGELIAQLDNNGMQVADLGALANDILLKAQKATEMMGVGKGQLVHVEAPGAHILIRCLNEMADPGSSAENCTHIHMVLALSRDGNIGMGKIRLASVMGELAPLLR